MTARPQPKPLDAAITEIKTVIADTIAAKLIFGAVIGVGDTHSMNFDALGLSDPQQRRSVTVDTIFDCASLTKIIATWATIGRLWDAGRLSLDTTVSDVLKQATGYPLGTVTVRELLTHTGGLPTVTQLEHYGVTRADIEQGILQEDLKRPPGTAVEYTDRSAFILGFIIEELLGPFDKVCEEEIWQPLAMTDTHFGLASADARTRTAVTDIDGHGHRLHGEVHDPSAQLLGGVCGSAGVFSTATDIAKFLRTVVAPSADATPWSDDWNQVSLCVHTGPLKPSRGLAWMVAPGTVASEGIFCHYGFTGPAIWVCRPLQRYVVLLANKVSYDQGRNDLAEMRNKVRSLAFEL